MKNEGLKMKSNWSLIDKRWTHSFFDIDVPRELQAAVCVGCQAPFEEKLGRLLVQVAIRFHEPMNREKRADLCYQTRLERLHLQFQSIVIGQRFASIGLVSFS